MPLTKETREELADILTDLFNDTGWRKCIVRSAFYSTIILNDIEWGGNSGDFTDRLLTVLDRHEQVDNQYSTVLLIDEVLENLGGGINSDRLKVLKVKIPKELSPGRGTTSPEPLTTPEVKPEQAPPATPEPLTTPEVKPEQAPPAATTTSKQAEQVPESKSNSQGQHNQTNSDNQPTIITPTPEPEKKKGLDPQIVAIVVAILSLIGVIGAALINSGFLDPAPTETPTPAITQVTDTPSPTDAPTTAPVTPASDTPSPPATDTPDTGTFAGTPVAGQIFVDEHSLTLFVENGGSLANIGYEYTDKGETVRKLLQEYDAFEGMTDAVSAGYCLRLLRSGEAVPLPQACEGQVSTGILSDADVFWYSELQGNFRTFFIMKDDERWGTCGARQPICPFSLP